MLKLPENIISGFGSFLSQKNVPTLSHNYYKKWLRYYLDYCYKYEHPAINPGSFPHFLNKLKEKKQTGAQQKQAHESIHLFYELVGQKPGLKRAVASIQHQKQWVKDIELNRKYENSINDPSPKQDSVVYSRKPEAGKEETNCDWRKTYTGLNYDSSFAPPISIKCFPLAVLGREWVCKRRQESE
jgi:hypothetical protein